MWHRLRRTAKKSRHPQIRLSMEPLEDRSVPAAFTAGNLVIYRISGSAALTSAATAVFLDEYTPAGSLVQSVALPTADSGTTHILTASGTATSEGGLSLSSDGRYLTFGGYDAAIGTANVAGTATSGATPVVRVLGRAAADGSIDTTTTTTGFSANNIRSVASTDGTNFWAAGANTGVVYLPLGGSGAGTLVSSSTTNLRVIQDVAGQLYVSSASGALRLGIVGSGSPTTAGTTITNLPNFPTSTATGSTSPYGYFFADLDGTAGLDTLYVADDSLGIQKYTLLSGNWTFNSTVTAGVVRGLTGVVSGNTVTLYATLYFTRPGVRHRRTPGS